MHTTKTTHPLCSFILAFSRIPLFSFVKGQEQEQRERERVVGWVSEERSEERAVTGGVVLCSFCSLSGPIRGSLKGLKLASKGSVRVL